MVCINIDTSLGVTRCDQIDTIEKTIWEDYLQGTPLFLIS